MLHYQLRHFIKILIHVQVVLNAGPRKRGVSDHDSPAGGDGVRHRSPETAAVRPDRQKPGEQKPSETAAPEVREAGNTQTTLQNILMGQSGIK